MTLGLTRKEKWESEEEVPAPSEMLNDDHKLEIQDEIEDLKKFRELARSIRKKSKGGKRRILYEAQDEIDSRKENLLVDIESRLSQKTSITDLFTFHWIMQ